MININIDNEAIFRWTCDAGHLETAKWLYCLSKTDNNRKININTDHYAAFRWTCSSGHFETAKWLHDLSRIDNNLVDIHVYGKCFWWACVNGHFEIANWLYRLLTVDVNIRIYIYATNERIFRKSYSDNQFKIIKWLFELSKANNKKFDIRTNNKYIFKLECSNSYGSGNIILSIQHHK